MKRHFIIDMYVRGCHWMSNMYYVPLHVWPCRYLIDLGTSFWRIYSEICEQLKGGNISKDVFSRFWKFAFIFLKKNHILVRFFFSFTKMIYNFGTCMYRSYMALGRTQKPYGFWKNPIFFSLTSLKTSILF